MAYQLGGYRKEWWEAGYPGNGDVYWRISVDVAETVAQARTEPEVSAIRSYRRLAASLATSAGMAATSAAEERIARADRCALP